MITLQKYFQCYHVMGRKNDNMRGDTDKHSEAKNVISSISLCQF
jgi:hypothetical protein